MRFTLGSSLAKLFFAVAIGLGLASHPAVAQEAAGKFTLAKDIRWGGAVLPAGEYTYALEHQTGQLLFLRNVTGQSGAIVLVRSVSQVSDRGHDRIILQRSGDDWFVSSMVITAIGQELSFAASNTHTEAAKSGASPAKVAALTNP
jgi:hypothetical protein